MAEIDAGTLPPGTELQCDVCIVGSGAAGITLAHRLKNTRKRIIVLESSLFNVRDPFAPQQLEAVQRFQTTSGEDARIFLDRARAEAPPELDVQAHNQDGHRYEDPATQPLYRGQLTAEMQRIDPRFLLRSRIRVYGGTTNCWGGWTRTLSPIDFDRSDLDPAYAWPIGYRDLYEPYKAALAYCSLRNIDPNDYDVPNAWVGKTQIPIAPIPPGPRLRTGVFSVMNGQGPHVDGALDFQHVWGPSLVSSENVTLVRNANVRRLEAPATTIDRAHAQNIDRTGGSPKPGNVVFSVRAKQYVLAMGGIETIRLLLLSKPGGLGNGSGTLGRYFMVHPLNQNAGYVDLTRTAPQNVVNFYTGFPRLKDDPYPPNIFATFVPSDATLRAERIGNFRSMVDFNSGSINLNWEQIPNPFSRIALAETRDMFGDREVLLDWKTLPIDATTARKAIDLTVAEMVRLGYARTGGGDPVITAPGDHHMGATRMSREPRNGYVDANCRSHEIANLYVASSSVFSTGGVSNPTLTIIALAVRLADYLARF
jgi:choline dehydrogenase-like flavoprotein